MKNGGTVSTVYLIEVRGTPDDVDRANAARISHAALEAIGVVINGYYPSSRDRAPAGDRDCGRPFAVRRTMVVLVDRMLEGSDPVGEQIIESCGAAGADLQHEAVFAGHVVNLLHLGIATNAASVWGAAALLGSHENECEQAEVHSRRNRSRCSRARAALELLDALEDGDGQADPPADLGIRDPGVGLQR
jgi:hypothetical protein